MFVIASKFAYAVSPRDSFELAPKVASDEYACVDPDTDVTFGLKRLDCQLPICVLVVVLWILITVNRNKVNEKSRVKTTYLPAKLDIDRSCDSFHVVNLTPWR